MKTFPATSVPILRDVLQCFFWRVGRSNIQVLMYHVPTTFGLRVEVQKTTYMTQGVEWITMRHMDIPDTLIESVPEAALTDHVIDITIELAYLLIEGDRTP